MYIDFFLDKFKEEKTSEAIIWNNKIYSYEMIYKYVQDNLKKLEQYIKKEMVVAIEADFSPQSVAMLIALIEYRCIIVPLTESVSHKKEEFKEIAEVEAVVKLNPDDSVEFITLGKSATNELIQRLKAKQHPGLILFSSGSTGRSKAAIHDFVPLLQKFKVSRKKMRTISFLLFDHIGGVNTLLYTLSNGGCIITVEERTPEIICKIIEKYKVEILPTSPTFINLILLSEAYIKYDLSSLQMVTYGTEVMLESTLLRFHDILPDVKLLQTYGLSEIGIMRSKSKSSDSLWVKIGGEDFATRVANGVLEIKAKSAMLGYLNAPSPFTEDGWFHTGDEVLVDGEYMKIMGRKSEIINVGGEKVYPAEVETVIQLMDNVEDVAVNGEKNIITGQIVKARVKLSTNETVTEFKRRMRKFCIGKLENFKVPQKVILVNEEMFGERFKKMRRE